MHDTLLQYLRDHPNKGFRAGARYHIDGDFVTVYFKQDRCYAKRIDGLTVYLAMDSNDLVGCKIESLVL